jgi:sortase B
MDTSCAPITIDFDSLNKRNNDVVGWLYCPDTVINYPVVQGEDNNQYLRRDLDGNYLRNGTLFADYRNTDLSDDENYIIYGHNMKNGTMFNALVKYKDQEYYDRHPVMYYLTPDGDYKLELFAGLVVRRDDGIYSANSWQEDKTEFLNEYLTRSTFRSEIAPSNNDVIVTLSTCSYEFDNARYVVIGRLIAI